MARDFIYSTVNPLDPNGPKTQVIIPSDYYQTLYKYHPVDYQNLIAAKFVLDEPKKLFFGVREYTQGGWCYTGRPPEWYIRENVIVPFPNHLVFAVYINPNMRV